MKTKTIKKIINRIKNIFSRRVLDLGKIIKLKKKGIGVY